MSDDSQLLALQKACEAKEQEALTRKREIERVVDERARLVDELKSEQEKLKSQLDRFLGPERTKAVKERDNLRLQSISEYAERVRAQMLGLEKDLAERNTDLARARERAALAESEHMTARMESRRVEKLLEERSLRELVRGTALEEVAADELSSSAVSQKVRP